MSTFTGGMVDIEGIFKINPHGVCMEWVNRNPTPFFYKIPQGGSNDQY